MLSIILARNATGVSGNNPSLAPSLAYPGNSALTSAIGAIVIEALTLVSAFYLFILLHRQGIEKLRTRYLLGMVASDAILGIAGLIPTANYLAGHPLTSGTKACSAVGFIITAVVFTQHLWTLVIAITTYALLKHPISRFTHLLHRYWYVSPIVVWLVSILHSLAWYLAWGYTESSGGALCFYGPGSKSYDRDLVQFIPRIIVFIAVFILYTRLFKFLRRPDSIALAESGTNTGDVNRIIAEQQERNHSRPAATGFWSEIGRAAGFPQKKSSMQPLGETVPPWELLHLNNVGLDLEKMAIPVTRPIDQEGRSSQRVPLSWKIPDDDLSRSDRIQTTSTLVGSDRARKLSSFDFAPHRATTQPTERDIQEGVVLPCLALTPGARSHHSFQSNEPPSPLQLDDKPLSDAGDQDISVQLQRSSSESVNPGDYDEKTSREQDESAGQELRNFFMANQTERHDDLEHTDAVDIRIGESAGAFRNRQASLLMLYFPLAYMFVFSFSLVRLLYNMITQKRNVGLTIASLWFVLSAGLVDAAVYGVAELVVRRRVRRNLPGRLSENPSKHYVSQ